MEYARKCQKCPYLKSVACYGMRKRQRTGSCILAFQEVRRKYVKNLPKEGRVTILK